MEYNRMRKIIEKTDTDEQQKEEGDSNLTSLKASSVCLWEAVRWRQKFVCSYLAAKRGLYCRGFHPPA